MIKIIKTDFNQLIKISFYHFYELLFRLKVLQDGTTLKQFKKKIFKI